MEARTSFAKSELSIDEEVAESKVALRFRSAGYVYEILYRPCEHSNDQDSLCSLSRRVKIVIMRHLSICLMPAVLAVLVGCEQRGPLVYVLESPQSVELTPSASASKVQQGETVVLHVARRTSGKWQQVPRDQLTPGQCWVYRPPQEVEPEVAHSIQWEVVPEGAVEFHTEYQMDQTRVATMTMKGKVKLTPVSAVKCEDNRSVVGPSIEIEVS